MSTGAPFHIPGVWKPVQVFRRMTGSQSLAACQSEYSQETGVGSQSRIWSQTLQCGGVPANILATRSKDHSSMNSGVTFQWCSECGSRAKKRKHFYEWKKKKTVDKCRGPLGRPDKLKGRLVTSVYSFPDLCFSLQKTAPNGTGIAHTIWALEPRQLGIQTSDLGLFLVH